jgi:hypothetical protein
VSLDRHLGLATLVAALLFLWPLLVYGRPGYIQDSAAYYKGGRAAVSYVLGKIERADPAPATATGAPAGAVQGATSVQPEVRGARSVAYSLAAYVLGAPNGQMWLLAVMQAFAAGFVCAVTLLLFGAAERQLWWKLATLAVVTPIAFVVCLAIPDIFAGIVILAIALLATAYRALSPGVRTVTVLVGAAGIAFHMSHPPIALGVTLLALGWMALAARRGSRVPRGHWAVVAAPFLLGAAATVVLNVAAFGGGPSLTGKRYPLTLARSVAEGPGKWYLDKNCGHLKFAICEIYPHGVPGTVHEFLWGPNGVKERATPEQLDRIRDEESAVVLAATRAYPLEDMEKLGKNFARQLVRFEPGIGLLDSRIVLDAQGTPQLETVPYSRLWTTLVNWLTFASVVLALVVLYRRFRSDPWLRPLVLLIGAGILLNIIVCVYFSGIVDRYGARTIWLLPLLALAVAERSRAAGGPAASPA